MAELFKNPIEAEIEALSREIAAKRKELEVQSGIVHEGAEKEFVRQSLREKIQAVQPVSSAPAAPVPPPPQKSAPAAGSYIDALDSETAEKVNALIQKFFTAGLEQAIKDAKSSDPYVLDAFHDALADRLYDELKQRKVVQ